MRPPRRASERGARTLAAVDRLEPQPWMASGGAPAVLAALAASGDRARFVGGCVRDALAGRAVNDIDIATPTHPDRVIRLLEDAGIRALPTGLSHGTVTAAVDGAGIEVTTLRRDVATDGRRATVAFTDDWAADAARRDFTMNALYCDPDGTVHDHTGGLADLRAGRVRFVGSARRRIVEDALRMLRFFRFHAWYGAGPPDAEALAACRELAPRLAGLAAERIWAELAKTLRAPEPAAAFASMEETGALAVVLGGAGRADRLAAAAACEAALGLAPSAVRRLAACLDCAEAEAPGARLRLSRGEARRLGAALRNAAALAPDLDRAAIRRALHRWGAPAFADALVRAAADGGGEARWGRLYAALAGWTRPAFPIKGADVTAGGVPEGPLVGALVREVEEWWIEEGCAPDRRACLDRLAALAAERRPGKEGHANGV